MTHSISTDLRQLFPCYRQVIDALDWQVVSQSQSSESGIAGIEISENAHRKKGLHGARGTQTLLLVSFKVIMAAASRASRTGVVWFKHTDLRIRDHLP
jgi:hypothetical protein